MERLEYEVIPELVQTTLTVFTGHTVSVMKWIIQLCEHLFMFDTVCRERSGSFYVLFPNAC